MAANANLHKAKSEKNDELCEDYDSEASEPVNIIFPLSVKPSSRNHERID